MSGVSTTFLVKYFAQELPPCCEVSPYITALAGEVFAPLIVIATLLFFLSFVTVQQGSIAVVTVFGNSSIFPEMAKAMLRWDRFYSNRAIFVQEQNDPAILLIWLDGHDISPPIRIDHESPNMNPGNANSEPNASVEIPLNP